MITDGGRPYAIAVLRLTAEVFEQLAVALIEILQGIAYNLPVHQILGVQNRQSWGAMETGGRHIIILTAGTYADIRVAVVGIDHGVSISAVAIIRAPYL